MNARIRFRSFGAAFIGGALVALLASACSGPSPDGHTQFKAPSTDTFKPVADMLGARCGSLDCHGNTARNMRIYSFRGLRLSAPDYPGGGPTTADEYEATYQSVLSLEPEEMGHVLFEHGDPTKLTMVLKARGLERHKAGTVWKTGSAADHCLISWLIGQVDNNACQQGQTLPNTPGPWSGTP